MSKIKVNQIEAATGSTITIPSGQTLDASSATLTLPSTVVTTTGTQTLTNKTLTSPVISSISNTGTLTLPTSTDTLVGKDTTDTLTNKTLTAPKIANGGFIADANGNEQVKFTTTASAVNEFTVINSATGSAPEIQSTGSDTNIDLKITPKGSGKIVLDGISFPNADGSANQVLQTNGSGVLSFGTISGSVFGTKLLHVRDEKAANTGAAQASESFTKVTLNTSMTNEISGASLSSDVITLPSGTYYIHAFVVGNYCSKIKGKLRNTTDSTDTLIGTSAEANNVGTDSYGDSKSFIIGRFTIAAQKNFEIQRRVADASNTSSGGRACNFGVVEVYSDVQIWKIS